MRPFDYPAVALVRRHGPAGYVTADGYRDWLRDEFAFRCGYCLLRERWVPGGFHIDHFRPVAIQPERATDYDNLLYSCATCNAAKGSRLVSDPTTAFTADAVSVGSDGLLVATTPEARRLIEHLGLNRPQYQEFRRVWLTIAAVVVTRPEAAHEVFGFPPDLPDLSALRPPGGNTKPGGVEQSHFRRRERGELPDLY